MTTTKGRKRNRFVNLLSAALIATTGLFASNAIAQEGPNTGNISVSGGIDFTNQYWYRGIAQENQGVIAQPWLEVGFALDDTTSLAIGTWNSLHDHRAPGTSSGIWFESDWYASISKQLTDTVELSVSYTVLYGPKFGGQFAEELGIGLSFDDSEGLGLSPSVALTIETDGGSDTNPAPTPPGTAPGDTGVLLELGIEPTFALSENESFDLTLAVPVTVGIDIDSYYENMRDKNDDFGYADVGLVVSTPMKWVGAEYGAWTLSAGVHFLWLGDSAQQVGEEFGVIGTGDHFHIYSSVGISFEY